eukprot:NODE_305_length_10201_cov_0.856464.p9 type:complete len:119 gc:universal NODE_305_length_10201_cov_0.856464:5141-5497(+)
MKRETRFLQNWQFLPSIQTDRFPPIWICCVGECGRGLFKSACLKISDGMYSFTDVTDQKYELEPISKLHVPKNPCEWSYIPKNYDLIITDYLTDELKFDTLATQLVQKYYQQKFAKEI